MESPSDASKQFQKSPDHNGFQDAASSHQIPTNLSFHQSTGGIDSPSNASPPPVITTSLSSADSNSTRRIRSHSLNDGTVHNSQTHHNSGILSTPSGEPITTKSRRKRNRSTIDTNTSERKASIMPHNARRNQQASNHATSPLVSSSIISSTPLPPPPEGIIYHDYSLPAEDSLSKRSGPRNAWNSFNSRQLKIPGATVAASEAKPVNYQSSSPLSRAAVTNSQAVKQSAGGSKLATTSPPSPPVIPLLTPLKTSLSSPSSPRGSRRKRKISMISNLSSPGASPRTPRYHSQNNSSRRSSPRHIELAHTSERSRKHSILSNISNPYRSGGDSPRDVPLSNILTDNEEEIKKRELEKSVKSLMDQTEENAAEDLDDSIYRLYTGYLCCWHFKIFPWNPLRRVVIYIVSSRLFKFSILFFILLNCIILALYDPTDPPAGTSGYIRNQIINYSEFFFVPIFFLEMVLKMIAMGVIAHKNAYLRNYWNLLDCIIVLTSIVSLFSAGLGSFFSTMRAVRVLRPLRAISSIGEIKMIIDALGYSCGLLLNAFLLLLTFVIFCTLVGIQLMGGRLRQHCYHDLTGNILGDGNSYCSIDWMPGKRCPDGYSCQIGESNYYYKDHISYDNFFSGLLLTFQALSVETYTGIIYRYSEAVGHFFTPLIVSIVVFGSLFLINLITSVLNDSYAKMTELQKQKGIAKPSFWIWTEIKDRCNAAYDAVVARIPRPLLKIQRKVFTKITNHKLFKLAITFIILINFIIMALDHHGIDPETVFIFDVFNSIFSIIFLLEAIVVILGLGPRKYFTQLSTLFDFLVMLMGLWESFAFFIGIQSVGFGTILRAVRLLRVLRFIQSWRSLRSVVLTVMNSVRPIFMVSILLLMFVFIMSLLAMHLFGGLWEDPNIAWDYRSLHLSMIRVLQIILNEDWNVSMLQAMDISKFYAIYFIVLYCIGKYVILSLFVIILLQNAVDEEKQSPVTFASAKAKIIRNLKKIIPGMKSTPKGDRAKKKAEKKKKKKKEQSVSIEEGDSAENPPPQLPQNNVQAQNKHIYPLQHQKTDPPAANGTADFSSMISDSPWLEDSEDPFLKVFSDDIVELKDQNSMNSNTKPVQSTAMASRDAKDAVPSLPESSSEEKIPSPPIESDKPVVNGDPPTKSNTENQPDLTSWNPFKRKLTQSDFSLLVIPPSFGPRRVLRYILSTRLFELGLVILILYSSVILVFDTPNLDPNSSFSTFLNVNSYVMSVIFTIEMMLKIFAYGLVLHPGSYLRDGWNRLDAFLVVISWLTLLDPTAGNMRVIRSLRAARSLRSLRSLRALRILRRFEGLATIVEVLTKSAFNILNVTIVCFFAFSIMAVLGVQLFKGSFYSCTNASYTTKTTCLAAGFEWVTYKRNFDNYWEAMQTLFKVATLEGFYDVLLMCQAARDHEHAPQVGEMHRWYMGLYIFAHIIIGRLFVGNLFVGVLISKFISVREQESSWSMLTEAQKRWVTLQIRLNRGLLIYVPPKPKRLWRRALHKIVTHTAFEFCIAILIVLFCIVQMFHHYPQGEKWDQMFLITDIIFNVLFSLEIVVKLLAFGIYYFKDWWNLFDFTIQVISLVGFVVSVSTGVSGFSISIFRLLRIFRLLILIKRLKHIQRLLRVIIISLPAIMNVSGVLLIVYFVYAILGMRLFGRTRWQESINEHANLSSFLPAFGFVARSSFGEDWQDIMESIPTEPPRCSWKWGDCVDHPLLPTLFSFSFILLAFYIGMSLFVAVALQNFSDVIEEVETSNLSDETLLRFKRLWKKYDTDHNGKIPFVHLVRFLYEFGPPLGFDASMKMADVPEFLSSLDLKPTGSGGMISAQETLAALCKKKYSTFIREDILKQINQSGIFVTGKKRLMGQQKRRSGAQAALWKEYTLETPGALTLTKKEKKKLRYRTVAATLGLSVKKLMTIREQMMSDLIAHIDELEEDEESNISADSFHEYINTPVSPNDRMESPVVSISRIEAGEQILSEDEALLRSTTRSTFANEKSDDIDSYNDDGTLSTSDSDEFSTVTSQSHSQTRTFDTHLSSSALQALTPVASTTSMEHSDDEDTFTESSSVHTEESFGEQALVRVQSTIRSLLQQDSTKIQRISTLKLGSIPSPGKQGVMSLPSSPAFTPTSLRDITDAEEIDLSIISDSDTD